jgi:hypothetical protein
MSNQENCAPHGVRPCILIQFTNFMEKPSAFVFRVGDGGRRSLRSVRKLLPHYKADNPHSCRRETFHSDV